ncbi:MAG: lipid-A-disaccharide synthase, partial [Calditrichaeota bacterium]|nr:lipid-A-disaccharide synthase [Calditrichota bacterium]
MSRVDPTIFVSAGEVSGDAHGAGVISALRKRFSNANFFGIGGDRMAAAGVELLAHVRTLAVIGFSEVIRLVP